MILIVGEKRNESRGIEIQMERERLKRQRGSGKKNGPSQRQ